MVGNRVRNRVRERVGDRVGSDTDMGWLRLAGSLKLQVSFAKESYKRNCILHKRPMILRSLPMVATS